MDFDIKQIQQARERIQKYIVKTPLLRAQNLDERLGCQVYLKPECMQVTNAFKIRGALNSVLSLSEEELRRGIVTASSGNHGRAIAYTAKMLGTKAVVVMPNTAPAAKIDAIRQLGAEVILSDPSERFRISEETAQQRGMTLVPPFNHYHVMAGQGTLGLEIMEQCPEQDTLMVPVSGGGLISGVATAVKSLHPETKVYGVEPAELPRYSESLKAGKPVTVPQKKTVADALVAQTPGSLCFPVVQKYVDAVAAVDDEYVLKAQKLLLMEGKLVAEAASCIGIGAILQGRLTVAPEEKVCFLITGGKISFDQLERLKDVEI